VSDLYEIAIEVSGTLTDANGNPLDADGNPAPVEQDESEEQE
jgi:hypothetical protein